MNSTWHPTWWDEQNDSSTWERVKEAIRRDWEQTKHDLHLAGGHELNQGIGDTIKQAANKQPIPADDRPNPPKVIGTWDDVEGPMRYGHGARRAYGEKYPHWSEGLETDLRLEWEQGKDEMKKGWDDVKHYVRHGYDSKNR